MSVHTIRASALETLTARVAELNKLATKLELPPLVLVAGPVYHRKEAVEGGALAGVTRYQFRAVADVELQGEAPRIKGYRFLARLEHFAAGNIIGKGLGALDFEADAWRVAGPVCRHCGLDRKRKVTYILEAPEAAGIVQVGSSCLSDYIGTTDAEAAARLFQLMGELVSRVGSDDEEGWGGGGGAPEIATLTYIAAAARATRRFGFKRSTDEQSTRSSADFAVAECPEDKGRKGDREAIEAWQEAQPRAVDVARAELVIAWAITSRDSTDYAHNLRVACSSPVLAGRVEGLLASAPAALDRHEGVERERKGEPEPAGHFGTAGARVERTARVMVARGYVGAWGEGVMLILRDSENYLFKAFCSGSLKETDDWSGTFAVKGTIKRHEQDKSGRPVTLLSRLAVERILTDREALGDFSELAPRREREPQTDSEPLAATG